jgi:pimeloyl-ACP methyl ester carboxylesterase
MEHCIINHHKIHYTDSQAEGKKIVLFVHGAGGNSTHTPPILKKNSEFRSICIDLPGHGKSEGDPTNSIETYTQFLFDFVTEKKLSGFILAGHSMGGLISQNFVLTHKGLVSGLVLLSTGSSLPVLPIILALTQSPENSKKVASLITKYAYFKGADETLKKIGNRMLEKTPSIVLHKDFSLCNTTDLTEKISEIAIPTLVICGVEDKMTPVRYSQLLHQKIKGSKLKLVEGAGHMVALEKPDIVYSGLLEWMAKTR